MGKGNTQLHLSTTLLCTFFLLQFLLPSTLSIIQQRYKAHQRQKKKKTTHFKETEQASEPESEMTRVLELLDQKWKT